MTSTIVQVRQPYVVCGCGWWAFSRTPATDLIGHRAAAKCRRKAEAFGKVELDVKVTTARERATAGRRRRRR